MSDRLFYAIDEAIHRAFSEGWESRQWALDHDLMDVQAWRYKKMKQAVKYAREAATAALSPQTRPKPAAGTDANPATHPSNTDKESK